MAFIIKCIQGHQAGKFLTGGGGWNAEYPEARIFRKGCVASEISSRVWRKLPGWNRLEVIEDYGLATEKLCCWLEGEGTRVPRRLPPAGMEI